MQAKVKELNGKQILFLNIDPKSEFALCNHVTKVNHGECVSIEIDRVMEELNIAIDHKLNIEEYKDA